jgi:hypothetical protein
MNDEKRSKIKEEKRNEEGYPIYIVPVPQAQSASK